MAHAVVPIDEPEEDLWLDDESLLPELGELDELIDDLGFDYAEPEEPEDEEREDDNE